jgi:acyl-CoA synthetase (NDP forming)
MSVRNLDKVFKPRAIAFIGATPKPHTVGAMLLKNLRDAEFKGNLMLVNPRYTEIAGLPVYPDVASLLRENGPMLKMARELGFAITPHPSEAAAMRVTKGL